MSDLPTKAAEIRAGLEGADEFDALETMSPQDTARDLVDRFRSGDCPFCGHDPYHYVDNGVGMERVAVTCCDLGIALFQDGDEQLSRASGERHEAANALSDLLNLIEQQAAELAEARAERDEWCGEADSQAQRRQEWKRRATTAESERDELLREKERLEAALVYGVNCLCSVRKNYEEPELGLWEDVTRAISQGNAALAPLGEE